MRLCVIRSVSYCFVAVIKYYDQSSLDKEADSLADGSRGLERAEKTWLPAGRTAAGTGSCIDHILTPCTANSKLQVG